MFNVFGKYKKDRFLSIFHIILMIQLFSKKKKKKSLFLISVFYSGLNKFIIFYNDIFKYIYNAIFIYK